MTDRISSDPSRNACFRSEEESSASAATDKAPAANAPSKEPSASALDVDWDHVSSGSSDSAAASAAMAAAAGMSGGTATAPMSTYGRAPGPSASEGPRPASPSTPPGPPAKPVTTAGASGNAARTSERDFLKGPYAAAGHVHDHNSVFAGAAALKGSTKEGVEAEALSVSAQVGKQNEIQGTVARLRVTDPGGAMSTEALTATAHAGFQNDDGTAGLNAGVMATAASAEITVKQSAFSVTGGVSAGIGGEGHVGVRDRSDGRTDICVRGAWGAVIAGACIAVPIRL